jgi:uncharacterized membrane protein (DUF106 family)
MGDSVRQITLEMGDLFLGWLLHFPRDVVLVLIALASAVLFVAVRKATTDQELLRRCAADKKQVRRRLREARSRRDREEVTRLRATRSRVSMKQLRGELKPLLVLVLPVAFLANWAWHRLDVHLPLKSGSDVMLEALFPPSSAGEAAHLVPTEGLATGASWAREIRPGQADGEAVGRAAWTMWYLPQRTTNRNALHFVLRHKEHTFKWSWRFDEKRHDSLDRQFTEASLRLRLWLPPVKLFGIVPGVPWLGLPAWLVGYLLLTLTFVALLKKLMRIS